MAVNSPPASRGLQTPLMAAQWLIHSLVHSCVRRLSVWLLSTYKVPARGQVVGRSQHLMVGRRPCSWGPRLLGE